MTDVREASKTKKRKPSRYVRRDAEFQKAMKALGLNNNPQLFKDLCKIMFVTGWNVGGSGLPRAKRKSRSSP